jgi:hypothetical protein
VDYLVVDVEERKFILPLSPWPKDPMLKEIGLYSLRNMFDGVRAMSWKMLSLAGFAPKEIDSLVSEVKAYIADSRNHTYGTT